MILYPCECPIQRRTCSCHKGGEAQIYAVRDLAGEPFILHRMAAAGNGKRKRSAKLMIGVVRTGKRGVFV